MKPWELRSPEVANLLNPAFCGQVLYVAIEAHQENCGRPFPWPFCFIVVPLVLHQATSETIDGRITQFQAWLNQNQPMKVGFAERARQTSPFVRESVTFLLQTGALIVDQSGGLVVSKPLRRIRRKIGRLPENEKCLQKALVLGKWLATAGPATTVFASLGIRP